MAKGKEAEEAEGEKAKAKAKKAKKKAKLQAIYNFCRSINPLIMLMVLLTHYFLAAFL